MSRPSNGSLKLVLAGAALSLVLLVLTFVSFWPDGDRIGRGQPMAESAHAGPPIPSDGREPSSLRAPIGNAPALMFPAGCEVGRDCWYFAYVDLDSGPGYHDYRCGVRSYQQHKGTDVAPVDPQARVVVSAAAGGVVIGRRDGMDDRPTGERSGSVEGSECGNGVRIDHGNGWVSQYCHLARGSVRVRKGDRVAAGEELGLIGASGLAELPHLHFQLEHDGVIVDPFTGSGPAAQTCSAGIAPEQSSLWPDQAQAYVPMVVYRAGLLTDIPDRDRAARGEYPSSASVDGDALVAYAVVLGAREGAKIVTEILDPEGQLVHRQEKAVERDYARFFSYSGRKRPEQGWRSGAYTARISVTGATPSGSYTARGEATLVLR